MSNTQQRKDIFAKQVLPMIPFDPETVTEFLERYSAFDAPASIKYHGARPGGWFDHSICVMQQLVLLTERNGLTWIRPESPYIVGFFHDVCKLDQYQFVRTDENNDPVYAWRSDTLFKGHGSKSVIMLASVCSLTEEEVTCICYHMGAFTEKELWNDYTRAVHQYPNVLWTHTADMIASHIYDK